jgi:branched-chain amino acid aminotransferase
MSSPSGRGDCAWIDGRLVDQADALVAVDDHGLLVGDGVFETAKVVDGRAFALGRHLARLRRSADGLGLTVPFDDERLRAAVTTLVDENQPGVGRLRITFTSGSGPLGSGRGDGPGTLVMVTGSAGNWDPTTKVITVDWPRNERSPAVGLKTTSYVENVLAVRAAHAVGATEALMANLAGHLCEGTGSNVFVGIGGRLITPPLSSGCLAGITRELVLEATDAVEEDMPMAILDEADEVFIASSTRDVQPVATIDDRDLPDAPGPLTRAAADAFAEVERANPDL